jgi:hypothetical protein
VQSGDVGAGEASEGEAAVAGLVNRAILRYMARKQVGQIDAALLARIDERAAELGQTRRVYVERALEAFVRVGEARPAGGWLRPTASPDPANRRGLLEKPPIRVEVAGLGKGPTAPIAKGKKK